jgi:hypothetical protein
MTKKACRNNVPVISPEIKNLGYIHILATKNPVFVERNLFTQTLLGGLRHWLVPAALAIPHCDRTDAVNKLLIQGTLDQGFTF